MALELDCGGETDAAAGHQTLLVLDLYNRKVRVSGIIALKSLSGL